MALILIVDDAQIMRIMVRRILQKEGHDILEASNGQEALQMAQTHNPDCVLLDLLIPDINGMEVLQALNDRHLKIPTIFLTADTQGTTRQKCLNLGALAVLYKPPKAGELQEAVKQALSFKDKEGP
ncbi:response regulator [Kamptonema formosum]|uniref:response regulator n=1 Tax=Kamptonema formosum TaxID=331992 RepID=UPI00035DB976|nr:response regulator [Oscillatoria sp. PCC 10802]